MVTASLWKLSGYSKLFRFRASILLRRALDFLEGTHLMHVTFQLTHFNTRVCFRRILSPRCLTWYLETKINWIRLPFAKRNIIIQFKNTYLLNCTKKNTSVHAPNSQERSHPYLNKVFSTVKNRKIPSWLGASKLIKWVGIAKDTYYQTALLILLPPPFSLHVLR